MAPSHEDRIRTLKLRRAAFKLELDNLKDLLDKYESGRSSSEIRVQFEELTSEFATFCKTQVELDGADDSGELLRERIALKATFGNYKARALDIVALTNPTLTIGASDPCTSNSPYSRAESYESEITLPKINLPTFAGSYEDWPGFSDQFRSTIHDSPRIDQCKKLMYLRSCLKGEPARTIESLGNSASNYLVAWEILEKRYNHPAIIVSNHLKALFEIPSVQKSAHRDLRAFLNNTEAHYRALQAQNQPTADTLLIYLFMSKIDGETTLKWKEHIRNTAFPIVETLFSFLHDRCKILEPLKQPNPNSSMSATLPITNRKRPFVRATNEPSTHEPKFNVKHAFTIQAHVKCSFCKGPHYTQTCDDFVKRSVVGRLKLVKDNKLCFNCLRLNHSATQCRATTCKKCHKKHHTLLHSDTPNNPPATIQANTTGLVTGIPSQVILSTAVIDLLDHNGKAHRCRVLLDSCSQSHFLTERFCKKVGLPMKPVSTSLCGMNQMSSAIKEKTHAQIKSRWNSYVKSLTFLVAKQISQQSPSDFIDRKTLGIPAGIHLADPEFHQPNEVDGLIGAQLFWDLLYVGQIVLANKTTKLQKTKLGWIVTGEILHKPQRTKPICNLTLDTLNENISKFWTLEEYSSKSILSPEEQACDNHYNIHTMRDPKSGRYTVQLPFKDNKTELGDIRQIALRRFLSLERTLNKNLDQKQQYVEFLREYEQLGHMSELKIDDNSGYYLPHHPVIKCDSITTKTRVVFDASARSSSGISLNDTLMVGPTIQEDLFSITVRFRLHKYVLTADIAKMYRQINLHRDDRKYHKILWRENLHDPIKTYQLNTVTYGTAPAPFLATKTLSRLAQDEQEKHPIGAKILIRDFYVDDLLTGADSLTEAASIRDELLSITTKGGFQLRQWVSNHPALIEPLKGDTAQAHITLSMSDTKKTLGLYWRASQDTLGYTFKHVESPQKFTKRTILSKIAQLFDPLGLVGPIIVQAKIIMQSLWKHQLDWDESIPFDIHTMWVAFQTQLPLINNISIPRRVISGNYQYLQLHGFCDASEKAYGACIYIRTTHTDYTHNTRLVCSKSRIAPLKTQTLPRLELCAAVSLVRLYNLVIKAMPITFQRTVFWSDSMIVLHWINTAPHTLKPFVANRVNEIQCNSSASQWHHVPSEYNPADILSRGANPSVFLDNRTWYQGPSWLCQSEDTWPKYELKTIDIPDKRKVTVLATTTKPDFSLLQKFSSFNRLRRVVAYCLRFTNSTRIQTKQTGPLSVEELKQATVCIMRLVQKSAFRKEMKDLESHSIPSKGNKLIALSPFLDNEGIMRVGGRLIRSELPYDVKHQIILPQHHHITHVLIRETHIAHGHIGVQGTLHAIRQAFWPIHGKVAVKTVIQKCIKCHRLKPTIPYYSMGQLTGHRVQVNRPFKICGVDYCGPFYIKEKKHRNTKKVKTYAAIFVCFSTKAVHIELVSDLTSDAFLAALRRVFARRGKASDIYSDNATTFVGADRELQCTLKSLLSNNPDNMIYNYLSNQNVKWHFIPPRAPHFGGLWEAAVKSCKHHLIRIVGNTVLTFEALSTYLTEIEAILNSRPLTQLSSDPNDLTPLTPGHFLIGDSLISMPEYDFTSSKVGRLSSWQHIQQLRQHFWQRWRKEYLNELTVRKKWHNNSSITLSEGMLVLLKEDHTPPLCWPMGRIIAVHPGEDGIIRVVTIKTIHGEYKRSIKKIAPLPLDPAEQMCTNV